MIRKWFQLIFPFTSIALTCSTYTTLAIAYERFPSSLNILLFASFCVSCSLLLFLPCFIYYICIIYMQGDNSTTNTFWRSFIPRSFFASITEKSRNARGFFCSINMLINNNLFQIGVNCFQLFSLPTQRMQSGALGKGKAPNKCSQMSASYQIKSKGKEN